MAIETTILKGSLIVAMPHMEDPNFKKSVILLCEHNDQGAMGIIVNRPLPYSLGQVYEGQEIENRINEDRPVHFGGPVQPEVGFILYMGGPDHPDSLDAGSGIKLGTSLDILRAIAKGEGPGTFIFALGYAGWGPDQLESEIARNDWLVVPCDPGIIFGAQAEDRWEKSVRSLGITPGLLTSATGMA